MNQLRLHVFLPACLFVLITVTLGYCQADKGTLIIYPDGHAGAVRALHKMPGNRLLSAGDDGVLLLWDYWENRILKHVAGYKTGSNDGQIRAIAYSSAMKQMSVAGNLSGGSSTTSGIRLYGERYDQQAFLRDATASQGQILSLAYSDDGRYLLAGDEFGKIAAWDVYYNIHTTRYLAHSAQVTGLVMASDDRFYSSSPDGWLKAWQLGEKQPQDSLYLPVDGIRCLAHSRTTDQLAVGGGNGEVLILNPDFSILYQHEESYPSTPNSLAFSPDGSWLIAGRSCAPNDPSLAFYRTSGSNWEKVGAYTAHLGEVFTVTFLEPDLAACAGDGKFAITLWGIHNGEPFPSHSLQGHAQAVKTIRYDNGSLLLATHDQRRYRFNYLTRNLQPLNRAIPEEDESPWHLRVTQFSDTEQGLLMLPERRLNRSLAGRRPEQAGELMSSVPVDHTGEDENLPNLPDDPTDYSLSAPESADHDEQQPRYTLSAALTLSDSDILPTPIMTDNGTRARKKHTLFHDDLEVVTLPRLEEPVGAFSVIQDRWAIVENGQEVGVYDFQGRHIARFTSLLGDVKAMAVSNDQTRLLTLQANHFIQLWNLEQIDQQLTNSFPSLWSVFLPQGQLEPIRTYGLDSLARMNQRSAWEAIIQRLDKAGESVDLYRIALRRIILDLRPMATFFLGDDGNWVLWTPENYYDTSPGGEKYIRWQLNRGLANNAKLFEVDQLAEFYHRPDVVAEVFRSGDPADQVLRRFELSGVKRNRIDNPPRISLESHAEGVTLDTDTATVVLRITDTGGGIDGVRLYINGKLAAPLREDEQKLENWSTRRGGELVLRYTLKLLPGPNEINAFTYNRMWVPSDEVTLDLMTENIMQSRRLYVITAGIDSYINPLFTLEYAVDDAKAFAESIFHYGRGIFDDVEHVELYDRSVSQDSLEIAFNWVAENAQPQDLFIFFYSGHGVVTEKTERAEEEFFLVPFNVPQLYKNDPQIRLMGISANMLRSWTSRIPAQRQVLILDACRSERAINAFYNLGREAGVGILAATGANDYTYEYKALGHGVFTYCLLEGIAGAGDADKDGIVTLKEIEAYLLDRVPELTRQYRSETQFPRTYVRDIDFPFSVIR